MKSKQLSLLPKSKVKKQHGGSLAVGKRRKIRPLNIKQSHHITMKSYHAVGPRSLFRHKKMILNVIRKFSFRFGVKVYEYAIQGNHIHLLVKAQSREGLQNFFRVVAGHTAQNILKDWPIIKVRGGAQNPDNNKKAKALGGAPEQKKTRAQHVNRGCLKNQRKFWSYLIYSRVVSWGREFKTVARYIQRNTLELLQIIAYEPRTSRSESNSS